MAVIIAALGGGAFAEALEDKPIAPDAWRALTTGKTLHYYKDGVLFGREYYRNDDGDVVFRFPDGLCAEGRWAYADGEYCFAYGPDLHCFLHVKRGADIVIISGEDGDEQTVGRIAENEPLSCAEAIES
ncbi:hypothetical protein [Pikeienuella sp. HZG-20]|uniref:hypothetical protein n=1 Tax=Paludibacillus litoralis TaxID=3133267 RepID=UPI0030ECBD3B